MQEVTGSGIKAVYSYSADGVKLRVRGSADDGYDYLGSVTLVRGESEDISGVEALFADGMFRIGDATQETMFFEKDHLGSVRAVINDSGAVLATNNYLPFGTRHSGGMLSDDVRYRFNGMELQTTGELNLLDFGARMYDNELGRWFVQDPLAEKYLSFSPYNYCVNNPLRFTDPTGMDIQDELKNKVEEKSGMDGFVQKIIDSRSFNSSTPPTSSKPDSSKSEGNSSKSEGNSGKTTPSIGQPQNYVEKTSGGSSSDPTPPGPDAELQAFVEQLNFATNAMMAVASKMNPYITVVGDAARTSGGRFFVLDLPKIGKAGGFLTFAAFTVIDAYGLYNYYNNPNANYVTTPEKFWTNVGIGAAGIISVPAGITLGGIEAFYPGGIKGAIKSEDKLMKETMNHSDMAYKLYIHSVVFKR